MKYVEFSDKICIEMSDIEPDPGPFCMSFGFDLGPLIQSLTSMGMINVPAVVKRSDGKWDVAIGYRRIRALHVLGESKVPCHVLEPSRFTPRQILLMNLHDNLSTRAFNPVETGMVLNRLTGHVSRQTILNTYMPLLNLPSYESMLHVYLRLENLDDPVKRALAEGRLSMQTIQAFLEMDHTDRLSVFDYVLKLNLNFNQQNQFIDILKDLSIKEEAPIRSVLPDRSLLDMMGRDEHNKPQKAKRVLDWLRHRRFPKLTLAEEAVRKRIAHLNLPKGVKIEPPPFFEKEEFLMHIAFKNGSALRNTLADLDQMEGMEDIVAPWDADK